MAADNHQVPESARGPNKAAAAQRHAGFGLLARRMSAWTTKSLLTAIILIAGLGFGRQVLRWWAADAPAADAAADAPSSAAPDGLGDPWQPHLLQFGDQSWSLRRQSITGDQAKAATALRRCCREAIERVTPDSGERPKNSPPTESESRLIESLGQRKPVAEELGKWQLYELTGGLPMVIGIRLTPPAGDGLAKGMQLAEPARRVVLWGLAIPQAAEVWSIYAFQPWAGADAADSSFSNLPIPPDSRRLVAMQVAAGGAMVAFAGPDRSAAWKQFYDDWFLRRGWKSLGAWQPAGSSWRVRYTQGGPQQSAVADIRLTPDGLGRCTGLLMTSGNLTSGK